MTVDNREHANAAVRETPERCVHGRGSRVYRGPGWAQALRASSAFQGRDTALVLPKVSGVAQGNRLRS